MCSSSSSTNEARAGRYCVAVFYHGRLWQCGHLLCPAAWVEGIKR